MTYCLLNYFCFRFLCSPFQGISLTHFYITPIQRRIRWIDGRVSECSWESQILSELRSIYPVLFCCVHMYLLFSTYFGPFLYSFLSWLAVTATPSKTRYSSTIFVFLIPLRWQSHNDKKRQRRIDALSGEENGVDWNWKNTSFTKGDVNYWHYFIFHFLPPPFIIGN